MPGPDAANTDAAVLQAVATAVREIDLSGTEAWADLDALSSNTHVDSVEVFADEIKVRGGSFEGPINVHCTLNYGNGADGLTVSETFPGRFEGSLSPAGPVILRLKVDTSSFYA